MKPYVVTLASLLFPLAAFAQVAGTPTSPLPGQKPAPEPVVPTDPIAEVAPARAAGQAASVRLANARENLVDYVRAQRLLFDNSPEYREAVAEHRVAFEAWQAARAAALAGLDTDAEYVEAKKIRESLGRQLEVEHARPSPDPIKIGALAEYRLSLGNRISAREAEVLGAGADVSAARKALLDAYAKVEDARRAFEIRLRTGPEFAAVRQSVRTAAEEHAYAITYASETARTADVLMRYAYYAQWISTLRPYVVGTPYIPNYTAYSAQPVYPQSGGIGYGLVPGQ